MGNITTYFSIGNTLQRGAFIARGQRHAIDAVVEAADKIAAARHDLVADLFAAVVGETPQVEQVAEHAQHLPRRAGLAERPANALEALQAAFAIDERSRSLGEGRRRQQDVGIILAGSAGKRRQHDDQRRLLERGERPLRVMAIEFRFDAEQQVSLARLCEHFIGIERVRQRPGDVSADAVGRFADKSERGAGQAPEFGCQGVQRTGLRALFGDVAEEDRSSGDRPGSAKRRWRG